MDAKGNVPSPRLSFTQLNPMIWELKYWKEGAGVAGGFPVAFLCGINLESSLIPTEPWHWFMAVRVVLKCPLPESHNQVGNAVGRVRIREHFGNCGAEHFESPVHLCGKHRYLGRTFPEGTFRARGS